MKKLFWLFVGLSCLSATFALLAVFYTIVATIICVVLMVVFGLAALIVRWLSNLPEHGHVICPDCGVNSILASAVHGFNRIRGWTWTCPRCGSTFPYKNHNT